MMDLEKAGYLCVPAKGRVVVIKARTVQAIVPLPDDPGRTVIIHSDIHTVVDDLSINVEDRFRRALAGDAAVPMLLNSLT